MKKTILYINHGDQHEDRVSRILGDLGFDGVWINPRREMTLPEELDAFCAVVVYGGEHSVNDNNRQVLAEQQWINRWVSASRPYLGLCLGAQFLARALGAEVKHHPEHLVETGYIRVEPAIKADDLITHPMHVYHWHNEGFDLPPDCERLACSVRYPNQAFRYRPHILGFQFHPEVTPAIMYHWFNDGGHDLVRRTSTRPERQLRDAKRFDPAIENWTQEMLKNWAANF